MVLGPGCDSLAASMAKRRYIAERTGAKEYDGARSDVEQATVEVLRHRGCKLPSPPWSNGKTIEGEPSTQGGVMRSCAVRVTDNGSKHRVTIERIEETHDDGGTHRSLLPDGDAEWELLERLAPAEASEIRAEADRRGEVAAEGCRYTCGGRASR